MTKIRRARESFAIEIGCVIWGSKQPSPEQSGLEMGLSRKDLWRVHLSTGKNPSTPTEDKVTENVIVAETLQTWTERDKDEMECGKMTPWHRYRDQEGKVTAPEGQVDLNDRVTYIIIFRS